MMHTLAFVGLLAMAAGAPATYDQRQDGDFNVRADVQNVVLIVAVPQKLPINDIFGALKNSKNHESEFQERADVRVMEAFVEPNTPYRVDIGADGERFADNDGRDVDVVIAGRRRADVGAPLEAEGEREEYKLVGAQEPCGPGRERDPVSLACRESAAEPAAAAVPPVEKSEKPEPVASPAS